LPFDPCIAQQVGRRRVFWATQPMVCGEYFLCGSNCGIPGLEYVDVVRGPAALKVIETAAATDTQSAVVVHATADVMETAAAVDLPDATLTAVVMRDRILSASRAGVASAVVSTGAVKTRIIVDIGAVT
jgi:hypothetical protein